MRALLLSAALRLLRASWRVHGLAPAPEGPVVLAAFHGELLPLVLLHAHWPATALTSRSRDGQLAAEVCADLGLQVVRGSTSKGALGALRGCLRVLAGGRCPALTVDGPRGPAEEPKAGAAALARRAGVPMVCVRVQAAPALRLRTWDRFLIPLPFARVELRYARLEGAALAGDGVARALAW